jgi:hypothetical protein
VLRNITALDMASVQLPLVKLCDFFSSDPKQQSAVIDMLARHSFIVLSDINEGENPYVETISAFERFLQEFSQEEKEACKGTHILTNS